MRVMVHGDVLLMFMLFPRQDMLICVQCEYGALFNVHLTPCFASGPEQVLKTSTFRVGLIHYYTR